MAGDRLPLAEMQRILLALGVCCFCGCGAGPHYSYTDCITTCVTVAPPVRTTPASPQKQQATPLASEAQATTATTPVVPTTTLDSDPLCIEGKIGGNATNGAQNVPGTGNGTVPCGQRPDETDRLIDDFAGNDYNADSGDYGDFGDDGGWSRRKRASGNIPESTSRHKRRSKGAEDSCTLSCSVTVTNPLHCYACKGAYCDNPQATQVCKPHEACWTVLTSDKRNGSIYERKCMSAYENEHGMNCDQHRQRHCFGTLHAMKCGHCCRTHLCNDKELSGRSGAEMVLRNSWSFFLIVAMRIL